MAIPRKHRLCLARYLSGLSLRFLQGCMLRMNWFRCCSGCLFIELTPNSKTLSTFAEDWKGSWRMNCWSFQPLLGCWRMRSAATACFNIAMSASGRGFPWCVCVCSKHICSLAAGKRQKKPTMHHEVPVADSSSWKIMPFLQAARRVWVEAIQAPFSLVVLVKISWEWKPHNHTIPQAQLSTRKGTTVVPVVPFSGGLGILALHPSLWLGDATMPFLYDIFWNIKIIRLLHIVEWDQEN